MWGIRNRTWLLWNFLANCLLFEVVLLLLGACSEGADKVKCVLLKSEWFAERLRIFPNVPGGIFIFFGDLDEVRRRSTFQTLTCRAMPETRLFSQKKHLCEKTASCTHFFVVCLNILREDWKPALPLGSLEVEKKLVIWDLGVPKMVVPPKHPKMIIFRRKTHGCWIPPFLWNNHLDKLTTLLGAVHLFGGLWASVTCRHLHMSTRVTYKLR